MAREVNLLLEHFSATHGPLPPPAAPQPPQPPRRLPYLLGKTGPDVSIVLIWRHRSVNKQIGLCPPQPPQIAFLLSTEGHSPPQPPPPFFFVSWNISMRPTHTHTCTLTHTAEPLKPFPRSEQMAGLEWRVMIKALRAVLLKCPGFFFFQKRQNGLSFPPRVTPPSLRWGRWWRRWGAPASSGSLRKV